MKQINGTQMGDVTIVEDTKIFGTIMGDVVVKNCNVTNSGTIMGDVKVKGNGSFTSYGTVMGKVSYPSKVTTGRTEPLQNRPSPYVEPVVDYDESTPNLNTWFKLVSKFKKDK